MRLSLVTCTRNPDPKRLQRVFEAVDRLRVPSGWERDYLVVDSASDHPVAKLPMMESFCTGRPWVRVFRTELPGLATARRLALGIITGDPIVWVDDDNLLDVAYLESVIEVVTTRPTAAVWGAGHIHVEFPEGVDAWVDRTKRAAFQERDVASDQFGGSKEWEPFFPVGSGLVTRRAVMDRWLAEMLAGRASLTGRRGAALSSGDDAQIIFGAVAGGWEVGVVAAQRLTHLIPRARTTLRYLMRLEFALAESVRVARAECFPGDDAARDALGDAALRPASRRSIAAALKEGSREGLLTFARSLGAASGILRTHDRPEPSWLRAAVRLLRLR